MTVSMAPTSMKYFCEYIHIASFYVSGIAVTVSIAPDSLFKLLLNSVQSTCFYDSGVNLTVFLVPVSVFKSLLPLYPLFLFVRYL